MKTLLEISDALAVGATLLLLPPAPVSAEPAGDALVIQARQIMERFVERGVWNNPLLAATRPEAGATSADKVMALVLAGYTRAQLDRGGWFNPYVPTRNYDAGHPLLAMALGDGATSAR